MTSVADLGPKPSSRPPELSLLDPRWAKAEPKGREHRQRPGPPCTGHELFGLGGGVPWGGFRLTLGQGAKGPSRSRWYAAFLHPRTDLPSPWGAGASDHLAPSCKSAPSPWNFRTLRPDFLPPKKPRSTQREFITKESLEATEGCRQWGCAEGCAGKQTENTASAVGNPGWVGTKPAPGLAAHVSLPLQRSPQKASAACPARLCLSSCLLCQHCSRSLWEKMSPRTYT